MGVLRVRFAVSLLLALECAFAAQPGDCKGLQTWSWSEVSGLPDLPWPESIAIPGAGKWRTDSEYGGRSQVVPTRAHLREPGSQSIRLFLDPRNPPPPPGRTGGNFRAEISPRPWHQPGPMGTETWVGWSYYLPSGYRNDPAGEITIFQGHVGRNGPPVEIYLMKGGDVMLGTHWGVYGTGQNHRYKRKKNTGIRLQPGRWYDFVMHVIWDVESGGRGVTELWIDDRHFRIDGGNVFDSDPGDPNVPYPGTVKLGMYKWPWRTDEGVAASEAAGIRQLELLLGPVRILQRGPDDPIGAAGCACVAPRGPRPDGS